MKQGPRHDAARAAGPGASQAQHGQGKRRRAAARGESRAEDLEARCSDLESRLSVCQQENAHLSEAAADIRLLGQVGGAIGRCASPAEVLATVLERLSALADIAYCAFIEPQDDGLVIRHEYAAAVGAGPIGAVLHASEDWLEELAGAGHGRREWFLSPDALSIPGRGPVPSSVLLLSSSPSEGAPRLFLAADVRRTAEQMAALLPLLWQVIGMARARIENLELARQLADLSAGVDQRARQCLANLDETNRFLPVEVAERERTEHGLRLAGVAVESATEGVVITDPSLRILAVNRAFREITGYGEAEVLGRQPSLLDSDRHDPAFYDAIRESVLDRGRWQGEVWNRRKDDTHYPALLSVSAVRDRRGQVTNYVGVFSDISAVKESEARYDFLAHHDPLTGLPNRLLFAARGEHAVARARRTGGRVAVLSVHLDLERFEHLDDTLGRPAEDELLGKVVQRLAPCVPPGDTLARLAGDELTVLLEELSDPTGAGTVARKLLDALATPFGIGGNELYVTACIGVSVFPEDGDDFATLVKQAANAMRRAREQARGSLQFYTAELTRTAVERLRLESGLRQALLRDELVLHFQPQVSVHTGEIVGVEALLRWRHPDLGLVYPDRFIPLAEETGLVEEIDVWVLRASCRQARNWLSAGLPPVRVAVNLSARGISTSPLPERVTATLAETGLDPDLLEIEITESSVMADLEAAVGTLRAVKSLGVTLALDDFGAGYSSLNYLRRFPIDRLKLDRSFIRQIAFDETAQAIARAAVELGHGLGLGVVAEGVETPAQLEFLRANNCDAYQGHLFAAALAPAELAELLCGVSS